MSRSLAFAMLTALSASLVAGPPAPAPGGCGRLYIVVRGDTLYSIARRCRSSVVAIAGASRLPDPRRIEVGQQLVIPGAGPPPAAESGKPESAADTGLSYRFTPGDTLYSLARWARTSVGAVIAANPGIDPHKVEIGDEIRLPAGAIAPDAARRREFGTGPGPALARGRGPAPVQAVVRRYDPLQTRPASPPPPPPPRAHADRPRPTAAPPPRAKPDDEDERQPEGM